MSSEYDIYRTPQRGPAFSVLGALVLLLLLGGGVFALWWLWNGMGRRDGVVVLNADAQPRAVEARGKLSELEQSNIEIYQRGRPSLVQVTNLAVGNRLFGLDTEEVPKGVGSGFVWSVDEREGQEGGYIVTNFHVVEGADAVQVTLFDHSVYEVRSSEAFGYPDKDIAVLYLRAPKAKLHPVAVGTSHDLKVGQIVFALGDPFGLDQTMTNGIVSALGRTIKSATNRPIQGVIQTSAPINPGNSGGPLLDSAGRLIGMNTAILSPSGSFAGIGFAIPVDEINRVVPQLVRHGKVSRPYLGVQIAEDQLARNLGIAQGALILKVVPGGPADKAGLRSTTRSKDGKIRLGDVIIAVDDQEISNGKELGQAIVAYQVGQEVTLTIVRHTANENDPQESATEHVKVRLEAAQ